MPGAYLESSASEGTRLAIKEWPSFAEANEGRFLCVLGQPLILGPDQIPRLALRASVSACSYFLLSASFLRSQRAIPVFKSSKLNSLSLTHTMPTSGRPWPSPKSEALISFPRHKADRNRAARLAMLLGVAGTTIPNKRTTQGGLGPWSS